MDWKDLSRLPEASTKSWRLGRTEHVGEGTKDPWRPLAGGEKPVSKVIKGHGGNRDLVASVMVSTFLETIRCTMHYSDHMPQGRGSQEISLKGIPHSNKTDQFRGNSAVVSFGCHLDWVWPIIRRSAATSYVSLLPGRREISY